MHQIWKLKCFLSCLAVVFAQSIETRCSVENEDVVGAARTGDAPNTSDIISNISRTLVGNIIVDHSDVVGASPVRAAPTTSEWSTIVLPTKVPLY